MCMVLLTWLFNLFTVKMYLYENSRLIVTIFDSNKSDVVRKFPRSVSKRVFGVQKYKTAQCRYKKRIYASENADNVINCK